MKITVLTDNHAGGNFLAEHGLSYIIEQNGEEILFDTGSSDVFLKNAEKSGININERIKTIVLSHGHWDHGGGLRFVNGKTLITHPKAFIKRYRKHDNSNIGLTQEKTEFEKRFKLITSEKPYNINENIIYLGEIPRNTSFESQATSFVDEDGKPDFVPDDSALAIIEKDKIVVVSGCAHSGICNIIEHAKKVTGTNKVKGVLGGFHLKHKNKQTQSTIDYFKKQNIKHIYPSHCTELPALTAFHEAFQTKQIKTGMVLEF